MADTPPTLSKSTGEEALVEYLERIAAHSERGWAFHVHLSKLRSHSRKEHLLYGLNLFRSLVDQYQGRMFVLRNSDLIAVFRDLRIAEIKERMRKMQFLFHDDPLFQMEQDAEAQFLTAYDLNRAHSEFLGLAQSFLAAAKCGPEPGAPEEEPDLARLGSLLGALATADLSGVVRYQPVCLLRDGQTMVPVFEELYVSVPDLERTLKAGVELAADRWLFQYLTRTLDKRMLALLTKGDEPARGAQRAGESLRARFLEGGKFSLNLNVATVLSPEFAAFDAGIGPAIRGTIALEFQMIDIYADLGRYFYVRDYAREREYRICLDGVSHPGLPFVDRAGLGLDLLKIYWTPDMADEAEGARQDELRSLVERAGASRVILCRCDSAQAVDFGRALGISLFQGKHLDAVEAAQSQEGGFLRSLGGDPAPVA